MLSLTACVVDVVFVIDSSGSIRAANVGNVDNWQLILNFTQDLVGLFNVGPAQTHVGCVEFGMLVNWCV